MSENEDPGSVRLSPIDALHRSAEATLTDFAGWRLPLRYTGDLVEHRAVRESAGLFDTSHMGQISVRGPDAGASLSFALVSDVALLATGAARYTMICEPDGGVVDDLIVYRLELDEYLVIANAANTEIVLNRLRGRISALATSITNETADRALFSLQGPQAAAIVEACVADNSALPGRFQFRSALIAGQNVLLARTGYTGEDGFEISVGAIGAEAVWRRLLDGDGELVPLTAGLGARDSLRLEAGLLLYGHELSLSRTPFAAGYGRVVDLGHEFVGRAALAVVVERGSNEVLVGIACRSQRSPRQGHAVNTADGRRVGVVTSGGPSPTLGRPIAMAYVDRAHADIGTEVHIDVRGRDEPAEIVSLPFYRRARSR